MSIECAGYSILSAWITVLCLSQALVPVQYAEYGYSSHLLRMIMLASDIAVALLLSAVSTKLKPKRLQFFLMPVGLILSVFVSLTILFPATDPNEGFLIVAAWAFAGFSMAILTVCWSYYFKPKGRFGNICNSTVPIMLSSILLVLMQFLNHLLPIIVLLLPLVSGAFWLAAHFKLKRQANPDGSDLRAFLHGYHESAIQDTLDLPQNRIRLYLFGNSCILGFIWSFGTSEPYSSWTFLFFGASGLFSSIIVYLLLSRPSLKPDSRFYMAVYPVTFFCLYLTTVAASPLVAMACMAALYSLLVAYQVVNQTFVKKIGINETVLTYGFFNKDRIFNNMGLLFGWMLAFATFSLDVANQQSFHLLASALLLSIAVIVIYPRKTRNAPEPPEKGRFAGESVDMWSLVFLELSTQYGLSKREMQVYQLLFFGKRRGEIHEILSITPNTVKTHVYNVYKKVNVHTQQELVDFTNTFYEERVGRRDPGRR